MKKNFFLILGILLLTSCTKPKKKKPEINPENKLVNWARPGVQGQMSGAYLVYRNELSIPDTLMKAESPQANTTQIHESYITEDGLAGMREMKQIIIPPNADLVLEQGGLHVMLMNLKSDLSFDDTVHVTLTFSQAGEKNVHVPVKAPN